MFTAPSVPRSMIAALLAIGIFSPVAQASSLSVTPVSVTLEEHKRSAALTLKNEGNETRVIQTELLRWTQQNGENVHTPTRDLLVNPPIVTLKPGQTQIIRIGLKRETDKSQELAYRLYVSEVPPPPREGFTGLRIALRLGIPVFVAPNGKLCSGSLSWRASLDSDGILQLTLLNRGNSHLSLNSIKVSDPVTGQQLAKSEQPPFTLLAGQSRQISQALPANWRGTQLSVVVGTDNGLVETKLVETKAAQEQPAR